MAKRRPKATVKLNQLASYRQAVGCLVELGEGRVDVESAPQCRLILEKVIDLGVVLARCDLHRRATV